MHNPHNKKVHPGVAVAICLAVVLFFYGLDQLVMVLQGLPLNPDMTPAR